MPINRNNAASLPWAFFASQQFSFGVGLGRAIAQSIDLDLPGKNED
jgi:hypothetical protein